LLTSCQNPLLPMAVLHLVDVWLQLFQHMFVLLLCV